MLTIKSIYYDNTSFASYVNTMVLIHCYLYLYHHLGADHPGGLGRSAEEEALERFTDDDVKAAIEALPDAFRIAVLLADVEGFSYKEIAEITDVPIGTVMSRIHRGRKALQKALFEVGNARGLVGAAGEGR